MAKKKAPGSKLKKVSPKKTSFKLADVEKRMKELKFSSHLSAQKISTALKKIKPRAKESMDKIPKERRESIEALKPKSKRFHGVKLSKLWFPPFFFKSKCRNRFGYLTPSAVRSSSRLPFNISNQVLLGQLGSLMGDPSRDTPQDSNIPAGYTYFGQFVDHDITLDVSSTLSSKTNANSINNMRTPILDLDSVYGRGPALDPYLYVFPSSGPSTAVKLQLGTNQNNGTGGPGGTGGFGGMQIQTDFDLPRMSNPLNPGSSSNTAIIGDPRNDENLIVSQLHHAMLKFHNKVVDFLLLASFTGDIFVEAKKIVIHHYQEVVLNDYLVRICGGAAVNDALANVKAPIGSSFRMPVEFAVAAFRFGHSQIRPSYWVNFKLINATLGQIFQFNRNPNLPVFSDRVVDFNAFVPTGISVPIFNNAKKIDSVLAGGLENLPGMSGLMAILATRNLRRALAMGLPSGQAVARHFGISPMTNAQLTSGLPANEVAVLNSNRGILLRKTPLWYYILREAAVLKAGNQLGPVGAKIVADTFVRMLKRDASSILNVSGGFTPFLPANSSGQFSLADLIKFAEVHLP